MDVSSRVRHETMGELLCRHDYLQDRVNTLESQIAHEREANEKLREQNATLNEEYNRVWNVLRTYNPTDIELQYIGFESVNVKRAP